MPAPHDKAVTNIADANKAVLIFAIVLLRSMILSESMSEAVRWFRRLPDGTELIKNRWHPHPRADYRDRWSSRSWTELCASLVQGTSASTLHCGWAPEIRHRLADRDRK